MKCTFRSSWALLFPVLFYLTGLFLCPSEDFHSLKNMGYAERKEYTWTDNDGEEHGDQALVHLKGVGYVLTFRDVYVSVIGLFVPFLIIGRMLFGEWQNEFECILFGNCVIGLALIALSTKCHIASTILYWAGIILASCIFNHIKQK